MRIPEIRARLSMLADEHGIPELAELADQLRRRRPVKVAPVASRPMTPALAAEIRAFAASHPAASQAHVGRTLNVNPGRVSETLRGKRA